ncbi:Nramp family divalent metal transporter [Nocardioides sp. NPDC006303]|uniref:Nramp family divalent metal transporter n=1 Tax=Nocardioides sp. NPDC006303 TaxID=3156747 RepID=UPI0033B84F2B
MSQDLSQSSVEQAATHWRIIGPGLVAAATGVGAADLIATLIAGSKFGYLLLWCVVVGCIMKLVLVEGVGRYSLVSGQTIFDGWASLGRWTSWYFAPFIVIWGFMCASAVMAGSGLALHALLPQLSTATWGVISGLVGLAFVFSGRYGFFEKFCAAMVAVMFVTMIYAAALTVPNLPELTNGLVPRIPDDGLINVLSLAGGLGGTVILVAYGNWIREKGWHTPAHMRLMRLDNTVAYVMTGIFVVSTLIVGAELLYSAGLAIDDGDRGMVDLAAVLSERYGTFAGTIFLIGFWATAMSTLVGAWNGVSLMFADFVGQLRGLTSEDPERGSSGTTYKMYVLWMTFPPMLPLFVGKPVWLILAFSVLSAFFMPFLSITLMLLLNSERVPREWRNGFIRNLLMGVAVLAFVALAVDQLTNTIGGG